MNLEDRVTANHLLLVDLKTGDIITQLAGYSLCNYDNIAELLQNVDENILNSNFKEYDEKQCYCDGWLDDTAGIIYMSNSAPGFIIFDTFKTQYLTITEWPEVIKQNLIKYQQATKIFLKNFRFVDFEIVHNMLQEHYAYNMSTAITNIHIGQPIPEYVSTWLKKRYYNTEDCIKNFDEILNELSIIKSMILLSTIKPVAPGKLNLYSYHCNEILNTSPDDHIYPYMDKETDVPLTLSFYL
jgi:hypothetical protein